MLGRIPLLFLLFFLLHVIIKNQRPGLEWPLVEAMSTICPWGFRELPHWSISTLLKYSISFLTSDPTVPRVPIATGAIAAIFSGSLVLVVVALYCIFKDIWRLLNEETSLLGLYLGWELLWIWFKDLYFILFIMYSLNYFS